MSGEVTLVLWFLGFSGLLLVLQAEAVASVQVLHLQNRAIEWGSLAWWGGDTQVMHMYLLDEERGGDLLLFIFCEGHTSNR